MSVEVIKDEKEITAYYTDKEWTNSKGIPARTGIDNSDIGSTDGDESIDSTEEELRKLSETKRKEEEEDERNYTNDDRETKEEEDTKDDDDDDDDNNDNDNDDDDDEST